MSRPWSVPNLLRSRFVFLVHVCATRRAMIDAWYTGPGHRVVPVVPPRPVALGYN